MQVRLHGVLKMEKKRSKCKTSHRKVFTVNEANPKEKVIYDFLFNQYNESDTIKDILYDYIISNNLQTAQHSVNIVQTLCNDSAKSNATLYTSCVNNSAVEYKESVMNSDFNINLDNIENEEIKIEYNKEDEIKQANDNALDFLNNGF